MGDLSKGAADRSMPFTPLGEVDLVTQTHVAAQSTFSNATLSLRSGLGLGCYSGDPNSEKRLDGRLDFGLRGFSRYVEDYLVLLGNHGGFVNEGRNGNLRHAQNRFSIRLFDNSTPNTELMLNLFPEPHREPFHQQIDGPRRDGANVCDQTRRTDLLKNVIVRQCYTEHINRIGMRTVVHRMACKSVD